MVISKSDNPLLLQIRTFKLLKCSIPFKLNPSSEELIFSAAFISSSLSTLFLSLSKCVRI